MASPKSVIRSQLELGGNLLQQFAKDLTDAEYFHTPSPGTNHAGWLLGHIACTEDWGMSTISGQAAKFDQPMRDLFDGGTTCHASAGKYPSRQEIDKMFRDARDATMQTLASFDEKPVGCALAGRRPGRFLPDARLAMGHDGHAPVLAPGPARLLPHGAEQTATAGVTTCGGAWPGPCRVCHHGLSCPGVCR